MIQAALLKWLCAGVRRASKVGPPPDGALRGLYYGDLEKNGGHWQVDYVHDTRLHAKPWVGVWYWPKDRSKRNGEPHHISEVRV